MNKTSSNFKSKINFVYSDNDSLSVIFQDNDLLMGVVGEFNKNLKELNNNTYDFIFYVAGVDIHHEDRLGKLKVTDEGINIRDKTVIENFYSKKIPLCGVLGGGYNKSFDKLIELHSMLHKNCASYF